LYQAVIQFDASVFIVGSQGDLDCLPGATNRNAVTAYCGLPGGARALRRLWLKSAASFIVLMRQLPLAPDRLSYKCS